MATNGKYHSYQATKPRIEGLTGRKQRGEICSLFPLATYLPRPLLRRPPAAGAAASASASRPRFVPSVMVGRPSLDKRLQAQSRREVARRRKAEQAAESATQQVAAKTEEEPVGTPHKPLTSPPFILCLYGGRSARERSRSRVYGAPL